MGNKRVFFYLWVVGIVFAIFAYYFIDRNLATFIHEHHWRFYLTKIPGLQTLVEWPAVIVQLAPILFFILLIFKRNTQGRRLLLSLFLSVLLVYLLKNDLKWVFSRYWPETWINDNLSWIRDQAYGFQWFQGKVFTGTDVTGSFPSGHSSVAFATLVSIGLFCRRILKVCVLLATLEALSMIAFNYHFLSDIVIGACLGITCALLCYDLFTQRLTTHRLFMT